PTASPSPNAAPGVQKASPTEAKVKRWFEFEQLSAATRYHFVENDNKRKAANTDQYQFIAKFRFKFDPKAIYSIAANLATGQSFPTFWNASGWGIPARHQKSFGVRQLYFDAKPTSKVELQAGSLYINYGETTEAISYDTDGYIQGERIQIRNPKSLYFDEVS